MDLITGGSGFIGGLLQRHLARLGRPHRVLSRTPLAHCPTVLGDLGNSTGLADACVGIERIFHCAGYAHAWADRTDEKAERHWRVNFAGSRNLVEAAGHAGVRRLVFLSSVKAMAEPGPVCADENFPGQPLTAYGQSKRAAEQAVLEAGGRYGMNVVNLRLAMVYGKGGKGNLARMGRLIQRGWFPPLPETGNHRSMVHVDDVVDVMLRVADDDRANGRTYNVTGPQAPSGRELYDSMRVALDLPPCSWAVPESVLRLAGCCGDMLEHVVRRRLPLDSEAIHRLLDSAWYSPARIERELCWRARIDLKAGLQEMFGR